MKIEIPVFHINLTDDEIRLALTDNGPRGKVTPKLAFFLSNEIVSLALEGKFGDDLQDYAASQIKHHIEEDAKHLCAVCHEKNPDQMIELPTRRKVKIHKGCS